MDGSRGGSVCREISAAGHHYTVTTRLLRFGSYESYDSCPIRIERYSGGAIELNGLYESFGLSRPTQSERSVLYGLVISTQSVRFFNTYGLFSLYESYESKYMDCMDCMDRMD